jgi:hypothetical protein
VELKLGKGGMVGLLSMADQGLSNLGALSRSYVEIVAIKQFEEKNEKAKATMTISDYTKKHGINRPQEHHPQAIGTNYRLT